MKISVIHLILWGWVIVALLAGTGAAQAKSCRVPGGTESSPTDFARDVRNQACDEFILQDGWYNFPDLTRPSITIRAEHAGKAQITNGFAITASGVTIDGISREGERRPIAVRAPGATIKNSSFSNFGKNAYGVGIWIYDEALSADQITVISNNTFDDWGGAGSGCVVIGTAQEKPNVIDKISVHVLNNRFVHGPTASRGINSAIQAFDPFLASGNYIDTIDGTPIQNKAMNSKIIGNTIVHCTSWGALYNRAFGGNQWIGNVVMHSDRGFDVFQGDGILFQDNIFYDVKYFGIIKNFNRGTHDVTFRNNTFYESSGWAAIIWDNSQGGTFSNIVFQDNIFCKTRGSAIAWRGPYDKSMWDEYGNVYWNSQRPSEPTTGSTGSSVQMDPKFAGVPDDFTISAPGLAGKGAKWPPRHDSDLR
jgi:hypothetical protein